MAAEQSARPTAKEHNANTRVRTHCKRRIWSLLPRRPNNLCAGQPIVRSSAAASVPVAHWRHSRDHYQVVATSCFKTKDPTIASANHKVHSTTRTVQSTMSTQRATPESAKLEAQSPKVQSPSIGTPLQEPNCLTNAARPPLSAEQTLRRQTSQQQSSTRNSFARVKLL